MKGHVYTKAWPDICARLLRTFRRLLFHGCWIRKQEMTRMKGHVYIPKVPH